VQIVYVDMDNVLVDFPSGVDQLSEEVKKEYEGDLDEIPNFFRELPPIEGALRGFRILSEHYDTYILSTAPWKNPTAWIDKLLWVQEYLLETAYKRLILSHNKNLNAGDYLIDDRTANGVSNFTGEHIHFGQSPFHDWDAVLDYLVP